METKTPAPPMYIDEIFDRLARNPGIGPWLQRNGPDIHGFKRFYSHPIEKEGLVVGYGNVGKHGDRCYVTLMPVADRWRIEGAIFANAPLPGEAAIVQVYGSSVRLPLREGQTIDDVLERIVRPGSNDGSKAA